MNHFSCCSLELALAAEGLLNLYPAWHKRRLDIYLHVEVRAPTGLQDLDIHLLVKVLDQQVSKVCAW